jgi:hypothetical protein
MIKALHIAHDHGKRNETILAMKIWVRYKF